MGRWHLARLKIKNKERASFCNIRMPKGKIPKKILELASYDYRIKIFCV